MSITNTQQNAVCFYNNGDFDRRSFTLMGLSAKDNDNAIGFFGTGFKYAIATLLRSGLLVRIIAGDTVYNFHTASSRFRDKDYTSIYCTFVEDGCEQKVELPFTTHLGINWSLWQAYRELFTNAKDEGGGVYLANVHASVLPYDVCIYVYEGTMPIEDFIDIYRNHGKYFLDQPTLVQGRSLRAIAKQHNSDNNVYYKTMYTGTNLDKPTYFTYDYTITVRLTEDRTLADTWYIRTHIGELWIHHMSYEQLIQYLPDVSSHKYFEHNLEFGYNPPSEQFINACTYLNKHNRPMPMWARELFTRSLSFDQQITQYTPTRHEMIRLRRAITVLHHHKLMVDADKLVFCGDLPNEVAGYYREGTIYISRTAFEKGQEFLLGTIYEEHLHMTRDCEDCSRTMQNILIDRIASLMSDVYELETENE